MLTVWGRANSSNVKRVVWCLEELGLPYERIDAGGAFGKLDQPEYLAMNPNGQIPVINDDGFVLWESNAILRYLAAQYGEGTLYLSDPKQRAVADKWMDWSNSSFFGVFKTLFFGLIRTPVEQRDNAAIEAAQERIITLLTMLNSELAKQPYLSGDSFGIGDISFACYVYAWFNLPVERPSFPHLEQWYERVSSRRAFKKVVALPLS